MDETMAPWVPCKNRTYAPVGSKQIKILGSGDKRSNTVTLTVSKDGVLLPIQTIWEGLTTASLPKYDFPEEFLTCFTEEVFVDDPGRRRKKRGSKWQSPQTMKEYLRYLILPYLTVRREMIVQNSETEQYERGDQALLIMDHHYSHYTDDVVSLCHELGIDVALIPKRATDLFSVLDVSINHPFKEKMREHFANYCTELIEEQIRNGVAEQNVQLDTKTKLMKPKAAQWMTLAYFDLKAKEKELICFGWDKIRRNVDDSVALDVDIDLEVE
ncbi:hypothetical protein GEMRC1_008527 [Eukaryota sp. GEM-RC1]